MCAKEQECEYVQCPLATKIISLSALGDIARRYDLSLDKHHLNKNSKETHVKTVTSQKNQEVLHVNVIVMEIVVKR